MFSFCFVDKLGYLTNCKFVIGQRDDYSSKRPRDKSNTYSGFNSGSTSPTSVKPKKFFKSRGDDDKPKAPPPTPAPPPQSLTKQYSRPARPAR